MSANRSISLLGTTAAMMGLLVTVTACATGAPPTSNPVQVAATSSEGGASTLGDGAAPGPAIPPSAATGGGQGGAGGAGTGGGGSAGGGASGAATSYSSLSSRVGFTWSYDADSSYPAVGAYQYNSSGGAITITHLATGRYRVSFAGLAIAGGVAHAQAYGSTSHYCAVDAWYPQAGAQIIDVSCFNADGVHADTRFVANFARGAESGARFSYLWAEQPANPSPYSPSASYRYDATDSAGIVVDRLGTGRYEVYLPAAGPTLTDSWYFQITAYGNPYRCKEVGYYAPTRKVTVICRTHLGGFADTRFALSFASGASILGRTSQPFRNSWGSNSVPSAELDHLSTGVYVMRLSGFPGDARGHVVAQAAIDEAEYCHIASWTASGPDLGARVVCFNPGGVAADAVFSVAATW